MRNRKQHGQIIRIGDRWYVRYWERRNVGGTIERKRVTHLIGQVTTRGKRPPADIVTGAERHMATINSGIIPAERIVTISDFVERVYLPWVEQHKRPSTAKGYRDIWEDHLKPLCGQVWLRETRTYHVQGWLNQIGAGKLSRNTLKHVKSVISGIFTLAKQQDYFQGENPTRDTAINPKAAEPKETYAYTIEEIKSILSANSHNPKHLPSIESWKVRRTDERLVSQWCPFGLGPTLRFDFPASPSHSELRHPQF